MNKTFFSAFPKWCFITTNYLVSVTLSCRLRCSRRLRTYKPGPVSWVRFGLVRLGIKGNKKLCHIVKANDKYDVLCLHEAVAIALTLCHSR